MKNKFYIIGVTYNIEGLFAIVNSVINHCLYAKSQGYTPIIDLKHYKNQYFKDFREFKDNVWEYFFEQPAGYNLDDINNDSDIAIGTNKFYEDLSLTLTNNAMPVDSSKLCDNNIIEKRQEHKNLLKINPETLEYLENGFKNTIKDGHDVLGVLCRGTDYILKKPIGEQIQPSPSQVIKKVKETIKKFPEIKRIYVATEDSNIYDLFKKEFGNILIENTQYKYSYNTDSKDFLAEIKTERKNHGYNIAREYLLSVYILSKCNYFVGGRTTGTKWAWILTDSWEYFYIWKLGCYGKSILEKLFYKTTTGKGNKKYDIYSILGIKVKIRIKNKK